LLSDHGRTSDAARATHNVIQGNLIGVTASGDGALGNTATGIYVHGSYNVIGGTEPGAGNVISGTQLVPDYPELFWNGSGIVIDVGGKDNVIQGNRIGTDPTGTFEVPNAGPGVSLLFASAMIGGDDPGAGNLISGNDGDGIAVRGNLVPNGPIGLWRADGDAFEHTYTLTGELLGTDFTSGVSGQAFAFDGIDDVYRDPENLTGASRRLLYSVQQLGSTMEAWVKTPDDNGTIITDGGGIDSETGMGLFVEDGRLVAIGSKGSSGEFNFELTGPVINDDQFHHVAVTWTGDTAANGVKLYVDGSLVAEGTALAAITGGSTLLHFGGHTTAPLPYLRGRLDEIGLYNSVLTAEEIATIHRQRSLNPRRFPAHRDGQLHRHRQGRQRSAIRGGELVPCRERCRRRGR
jgi:hypothetical protein